MPVRAACPETSPSAPPVAVIDIGSNSGRVVVLERDRAGHFRLADRIARAAPAGPRRRRAGEPQRSVDGAHHGGHPGLPCHRGRRRARTHRRRRDRGDAGCAQRPAASWIGSAASCGIRVEIIDGQQEARYGFAGAVRGLPVSSGMLFDLGGGSMQVSHFRGRRLGEAQPATRRAPPEREVSRVRSAPQPRDPSSARTRLEALEGVARGPARRVRTSGRHRRHAAQPRQDRPERARLSDQPAPRLRALADGLHGIVEQSCTMRQKNRDDISGAERRARRLDRRRRRRD